MYVISLSSFIIGDTFSQYITCLLGAIQFSYIRTWRTEFPTNTYTVFRIFHIF